MLFLAYKEAPYIRCDINYYLSIIKTALLHRTLMLFYDTVQLYHDVHLHLVTVCSTSITSLKLCLLRRLV
jgi:hypothetical protein